MLKRVSLVATCPVHLQPILPSSQMSSTQNTGNSCHYTRRGHGLIGGSCFVYVTAGMSILQGYYTACAFENYSVKRTKNNSGYCIQKRVLLFKPDKSFIASPSPEYYTKLHYYY